MDIGAEISKKLQLAIKAKLTELDAYVDDELPDYIMIMIANKKPQSQMFEALSLFLSDDTQTFTKWLYDLLDSLQGSSEKKQENNKSTKEEPSKTISPNNNANVSAKKVEKKASRKESTSEKEKEYSSKTVERRDSVKASQKTKLEKAPVRKSTSDEVFDILPDMDDFLGMELMGNDDSINKKQRSTKTEPKPTARTERKSPEKNSNHKKESEIKKDHFTSKTQAELPKEKSIASLSKTSRKTVRVKTSDSSSSKSRKPSTERSSSASSKKIVRAWDRGKESRMDDFASQEAPNDARRKLNRKFRNIAPPESDSEDEVRSSKPSGSVVSVVSSVKTAPGYVSDDDSDGNMKSKGKVVSTVAVPAKRPRLPLNKQANKSLLLKAVSEAENSIRQSRLNRALKSNAKNEKQLITLAKNNLGSRLGKRATVVDHKPSSSKETHKRNYDLTTPDEIPRKRRSSGVEATNSVEVQHHSKEKMPEPVQNKTETRNEVKDSRIFIKKDKKIIKNIDNSVEKKQSIIQKQTPVSNKKQIDSKKVTLKNGKALPPKQAIKKKQRRSPSPRFIVTLDGTRTSTTASSKNNLDINEVLPKKKPFKKVPIQAPDSTSKTEEDENQCVTSSSVKLPVQKPLVISMSSSNEHEGDNVDSSDLELMNMREKLIKMQEDAKKLKQIQSQQLALLQETASIKKAAEKQQNDSENSDNKSIHVANVHFSATEKQLSEHFSICGKVKRTTILKDAFTGHPKGFAYLQFEEPNSVSMALAFDGTTFCSRIIKVTKKSNEAAAKVIVAAPYRRPARSFPPPRFPGGRFSSRYASSGAYRSRGRAMGARNKKWVKPGLLST